MIWWSDDLIYQWEWYLFACSFYCFAQKLVNKIWQKTIHTNSILLLKNSLIFSLPAYSIAVCPKSSFSVGSAPATIIVTIKQQLKLIFQLHVFLKCNQAKYSPVSLTINFEDLTNHTFFKPQKPSDISRGQAWLTFKSNNNTFQGHPKTVFCELSVQRSKLYSLKISFA